MAETPILKIRTPNSGDKYALVQDLGVLADTVEAAILNPPRVRLSSTTDADLTSTNHAFQIGPTSGTNLIMDNNEIQVRNNGNFAQLNIQAEGGTLIFGNDESLVLSRGGFQEGWNDLGTDNLNNIVRGGRYVQPSTSRATAARNYPSERGGVLEVLSNAPSGATSGYRLQRYTVAAIPMSWIRSWGSSGWGDWKQETPLSGSYDFSTLDGNTVRSVAISFPAGTFITTPTVVPVAHTSTPRNIQVSVNGVSRAGFTLFAQRNDGVANTRVSWIAF